MEQLARQLWEDLRLSAPCDLDKVCDHFGLQLVKCPLGSEISAFYLTLPSGRAEIIVNSQDSALRRRFSIAHELGHHILSKEPSEKVRLLPKLSLSAGDDERSATRFAACLLMPEWLVTGWYNELAGDPLRRLSLLSEKFQVSRNAMRVCLRELGLPIVVRWRVREITREGKVMSNE